MIRNIVMVCVVLALVLVQAPSKEAGVLERNLMRRPLDRLAQDPVIVKVSVLDEKTGSFVLDLKAEDFMTEEDGERQKPTRFLRDERPLSILLLLDSSGSMRPIIDRIIKALSNGLKRLKPDDEVALMSFHKELYVLQDFTRNKGLVEEKLRGVIAARATLTRQALFQAAKHMIKATAADSHRVIVVVTDNSSTPEEVLSEKVVMQQLSASGSVVCGIIVSNHGPVLGPYPPNAPASGGPYPPTARAGGRPYPPNAPAGGRPYPAPLRKPAGDITPYVDETGGIVEKEVKTEDISARLVKTIDAFRNYYWIEYLSTNSMKDGKHRKINVTLSPDVKRRGGKLTLLTKRGYYAPDNTGSGDPK
ncbi:MAG: VWA domain-containing protein [Acidobacteriota bacterium]